MAIQTHLRSCWNIFLAPDLYLIPAMLTYNNKIINHYTTLNLNPNDVVTILIPFLDCLNPHKEQTSIPFGLSHSMKSVYFLHIGHVFLTIITSSISSCSIFPPPYFKSPLSNNACSLVSSNLISEI